MAIWLNLTTFSTSINYENSTQNRSRNCIHNLSGLLLDLYRSYDSVIALTINYTVLNTVEPCLAVFFCNRYAMQLPSVFDAEVCRRKPKQSFPFFCGIEYLTEVFNITRRLRFYVVTKIFKPSDLFSKYRISQKKRTKRI